MNYIKVTTTYPTGGTLLPNAFVDNYMIRANGEYTKVYIYLLRMVTAGSDCSISCLADVLELTERDVTRALKYWEKESLIRMECRNGVIESIELLPIPEKPKNPIIKLQSQPQPEFESLPSAQPIQLARIQSENEIAVSETPLPQEPKGMEAVPAMKTLSPMELQKKGSDERFSYLLYVCEMFIGKPLTCNDMNTLLYMYEDLSMSCELIEYLVDYCVSNDKKSFRYMQQVAINWYENNVTTVEDAKLYNKNYKKEYYSIMRAFGLTQNPAPVQEKYMKQWLEDASMDLSLIIEACNRTINAINKPSFPYTDKILKQWKDHHITTIEEAKAFYQNQKEPKPFNNTSHSRPVHNFTQRDYDFDALEKQLLQKQFSDEIRES